MTAKLVVDYLSPKLPQGASSYHIDMADTIFLDAVVPQDIRPRFVEAVEFRAGSSSTQGSPLESLVKECHRLGLGRKDCFLLGGGAKMDDGRILVFAGGNVLKKKKSIRKKKKAAPKPKKQTTNSNGDTSWLNQSGLSPEQMQVIMSAMSDVNNEPKTPDQSQTSTQAEDKTTPDSVSEKDEHSSSPKVLENASVQSSEIEENKAKQQEKKIEMGTSRRKRTSKLPPSGPTGLQRPMTPSQNRLPNLNRPKTPQKKQQKTTEKNPVGLMPSASNLSVQKEVIGGPPPLTSNPPSERALRRRMRSMERRSKIRMYEESFDSPLQTTWRDDLWDFAAHGLFHKFFLLSLFLPMCKLKCSLFCLVTVVVV